MRKLLLLLFLFSLSTNALAKVEIWECATGNFEYAIKLNTDIPKVYNRINGAWLAKEEGDTIYDEENNSIVIFGFGDLNTKLVYDFILKERIQLIPHPTRPDEIPPLRAKANCKVIG